MVFLRKAQQDDLDLLFKWANDPIVRRNSFNTDPIPYENHVKWFDKIMKDPTLLQFVLMDDGTPVGQIRLNVEGADAEIGYSIASEFRGRGYGHMILQLVADEVRKNHQEIKNLVARVKPDNIASNKLFIKEGYMTDYVCYSMSVNK